MVIGLSLFFLSDLCGREDEIYRFLIDTKFLSDLCGREDSRTLGTKD